MFAKTMTIRLSSARAQAIFEIMTHLCCDHEDTIKPLLSCHDSNKRKNQHQQQQQYINEKQTSLAPQDGRTSVDRIHATRESSSRRANGYAQFKTHSPTLFIMIEMTLG